MMTSQCGHCLHFIGTAEDQPDKLICLAFPDGIPDGILSGDVDHSKPIEGDHGFQYTPANPALD